MSPEEEIQRAREAEQMLRTPLFEAARAHIGEQLRTLRQKVPIYNGEMHTRLILMEQIAEQFFGYFERIAQTGKLAQIEIDKRSTARRVFEDGIRRYQQGGRNLM